MEQAMHMASLRDHIMNKDIRKKTSHRHGSQAKQAEVGRVHRKTEGRWGKKFLNGGHEPASKASSDARLPG